MPRFGSAKTVYVACAILLALPAVLRLAGLLHPAGAFMDSYLTGNPAPPALVRLADFLWTGLCLAGLWLAHRRLGPGWRGWQIGLIGVLFAVVPPFGSHDAVYYFRMAAHWAGGHAPYSEPFMVFNPFLGGGVATDADFLPYPPLWVLVAGALYRLAGGHLTAFFGLLKLLLGACHLLNFLLLRRILGGRAGAEAVAWAYLVHPLFLLDGLSMMHFDLLWLTGCLAAAWLLREGRWWPAVLAGAAAFWLKYSALFAVPLYLPLLLDPAVPRRRRLGWLAGGIALAVLLGALAGLPFGDWPGIVRGAREMTAWAINSPLAALQWLGRMPATGRTWLRIGLGLAALGLAAAVRPRPDPRTPDGAAAWTVLALLAYLLVASPPFWPWYALWPLFFSLLLTGSRWAWLQRPAGWFAAAAFLYYPLLYLEGHIRASHDPVFQALYTLLSRGPALACLLAGLRVSRPEMPDGAGAGERPCNFS